MPKTYGRLKTKKFSPPKPTRGGSSEWLDKKQEAPLTGVVQETRAAQGEERFSRTLNKSIGKGFLKQYFFRWTTLKRSTVNYKELDFLIFGPNFTKAVSVKDLSFVHNGAAREKDKLSELIIMKKLQELGIRVDRIETVDAAKLKTQEGADREGKRLGVYR